MPKITLPDGAVLSFDEPITVADVAASIGPRLAKATLGARVNGELRDAGATIAQDATVELVTARDKAGRSSADALYLIRHSCAHVMAEAIQRLFPGVQLVYGPPVDNGFYYDLAVPPERPLAAGDFSAIEQEMAAIIAADRPFTRYELPGAAGLTKLAQEGSKYKIDNAERAIAGGSQTLSWYATGAPGSGFEDLCQGPHVPSTGRIGAFKVMSIAASYWHGDAASDSLTRVYGTAWADKEQLDAHLRQLEEAKLRDHRVLGKQLHLFVLDDLVGPGLVLWPPHGAILRRELEEFIRAELTKQGYQQVYTPHIGKLDLYRTSGHFPYYQDSQYPPMILHEQLQALATEGASCAELANRLHSGAVEGYLLKPMNCPHHIRIYASQQRSYRDLPVRLAEFGTVYRWEQSGEINGMVRVRGFTQDDAHLFCREDQAAAEMRGCLKLVRHIFDTLGMADFRVRVGLRNPDSSKYVGVPEDWDRAEAVCREGAASLGRPFTEEPGEAAFYGPKIDFIVRDVIGREWQLGTIQVDYNLPERFDLGYIGADNQWHRPVMIHRAPFGAFERFVGVLIEHFSGSFPTWLAPEQVRVMPISEKTTEYGARVLERLAAMGARAQVDDSNNRIQAKVRAAAEARVPYMLVVGPRDEEAETVSVRARGIRSDLGAIPLAAFLGSLAEEIRTRGAVTVLGHHFPGAGAEA
ncbi:MAG: threonine--tRNA ligase [Candidatus Schekmanbacteria bacterium]|nr:threonine--tRNA ligase [Candidatus Schekmanbacteria bacterium]